MRLRNFVLVAVVAATLSPPSPLVSAVSARQGEHILATPDESIQRACHPLVTTEFTIGGPKPVRALLRSCRTPDTPTKGVVIHLVGGRERPEPELSATDVASIAAGYDMVVPWYASAADLSAPVEELAHAEVIPDAIADVQTTLAWARSRYHRVLVVGDSLGGYLAAASCEGMCADGLLLASPLLQTPDRGWKEWGQFQPFPWSSVSGVNPEELTPEEREILRRFPTYGFFGRWKDTSLLDLLRKVDSEIPKLIIVGERDERIGLKEIPLIRAAQSELNARIEVIPGVGHENPLKYPGGEAAVFRFLLDPETKGRLASGIQGCVARSAGFAKRCSDDRGLLGWAGCSERGRT